MMKSLIVIIFLLCVCTATYADASAFKCNPAGNQAELNQCALDEYQAADRKLNDTWKKLMAKFKNDKTATAKLKAAQKAWLAFRDAEIEATFACDTGDRRCWGSMEPMLRYGELTSLTQARTARLQKYLQNGLGVSMN
ncbi:lysozyme inhibitor LprI family protein [Thiothrix eikelboomii]|uniref:lysozyme inhibitor LprI family protein n=1 Tax=Thiothrix eikelboomii TaxID=92487 RepID=UPI003BAEF2C2